MEESPIRSQATNSAEVKTISVTDFDKGSEFFKQLLESTLTPEEQAQVIDGTIASLAKMKTELQKPGASPLTTEQLLSKIQTAVLAKTFSAKSPSLSTRAPGAPLHGITAHGISTEAAPPHGITAWGISENRADTRHWNDLKPTAAEDPKPEDK